MSSSDSVELTQATIDDLTIDNVIYVRGRRAQIASLDFPLVFWRFDGDSVIRHRSFLCSREMFQVPLHQQSNIQSVSNTSITVSSDSGDGDDWASFDSVPVPNATSTLPASSSTSSSDSAVILSSFTTPSATMADLLAELDDFEFAAPTSASTGSDAEPASSSSSSSEPSSTSSSHDASFSSESTSSTESSSSAASAEDKPVTPASSEPEAVAASGANNLLCE